MPSGTTSMRERGTSSKIGRASRREGCGASSDVCSSDLVARGLKPGPRRADAPAKADIRLGEDVQPLFGRHAREVPDRKRPAVVLMTRVAVQTDAERHDVDAGARHVE